jgi:hypothetical protein
MNKSVNNSSIKCIVTNVSCLNKTIIENDLVNSRFYFTYEQWLEMLGFSMFNEILVLFTIPSLGILGILFNTIALWCLLDKKFKKTNLYKYLRVYMCNSLLICILCIGFICQSRRFTNIADQHWALFYRAYIQLPLLFLLYSNTGLIDIVIILDRISITSNSSRLLFVKRSRPYLVCFVLFVIALALNGTIWINFMPITLIVSLSNTKLHTFNILNHTPYLISPIGQLIINLQMAFRDILVFVAQFVLNVLLLLTLKKRLKKKFQILFGTRLMTLNESKKGNSPGIDNSGSVSTLKNKDKEASNGSDSRETSANISSLMSENLAKLSRADLNATLMVSILTFISMIEHFIFFLAMLYRWSTISLLFFNISMIFVALKHFSNFIVLFTFNSNFKHVFLKKALFYR